MFKYPEKYRVDPGMARAVGVNDVFVIKKKYRVLASLVGGWEHVSVTVLKGNRCPTWKEMCMVKALFWDEQDMVIQFHPPKSEYVNIHDYCLHMWRKENTNDFVLEPPERIA